MDQTRGWCSRTGSPRKVWSWIPPGRPGKECWRRVKTATRLAVSVRQTGLLCPLLHPRRRVCCSRAPTPRHWWTLCACRRWLRGAPPFLRAVSVGFARASLLPRSRVSLRSALPWNPPDYVSALLRYSLLWVQRVYINIYISLNSVSLHREAAVTSRNAHSCATYRAATVNSLHDWTPVERGGRDEMGGAWESSGGLSQIDKYEGAGPHVSKPIRQQHRLDRQTIPPMGSHQIMPATDWNEDYPLLYIKLSHSAAHYK